MKIIPAWYGITAPDDAVIKVGTDADQALLNRSTALGANTALTGVLIGTPVTAATPANSLMMSNITANGDFAWFLNDTSGNSWEYLRFDGSAKLIVFNEASSDIDFRIESDGNSNMFVVDAGLNAVAIGTSLDAGYTLGVAVSKTDAIINNQGFRINGYGGTYTDNGAARTVASAADLVIAPPTITNASNAVTITDIAGIWIQTAPIAGANVTLTRKYALWVDADLSRFDDSILVGVTAASALPTSAIYSTGGVMVGANSTNALFDDASNGAGTTTMYIGNASINVTSDVRVKDKIEDFDGSAIELLNRARIISFAWDDPTDRNPWGKNSRGRYVGMLAQETIEWAPWAINPGSGRDCLLCRAGEPCEEHGYWFAEYVHLVPLMVKGMQELSRRIGDLEKRN